MSQPSIPQGELYVLLKIIYRHPLCVKNVFQIYWWFFFFCVCVFLSKLICIYLFDNINCSHLSNQVNCDCFKSTKEILCLLKETNSSSDFSKVLIYCICSKFSLKGTMFNAQKHLQPFILSWRMHWFQKLCYSHPLCNPYNKMFSL